jgi:hypothetical protein
LITSISSFSKKGKTMGLFGALHVATVAAAAVVVVPRDALKRLSGSDIDHADEAPSSDIASTEADEAASSKLDS